MTGLDAKTYWSCYYAEEFVFGLGTEEIIEYLREVPEVETWIDVGSGSESLLWACVLTVKELLAVDANADRLALLQECATATGLRGCYRTVLELAGRAASDWPSIRGVLRDVRVADCLAGTPPVPDRAELVTQFGLLGLCQDEPTFLRCFTALAKLASPGGWLAGANWMAADGAGRVRLTEELYRSALQECSAHVVRLEKIDSADPDYPYVWTYLARVPAS